MNLRILARACNAIFIKDQACGIDYQKKIIHLESGRPPIHFDVLSINLGSCPKVSLHDQDGKLVDQEFIQKMNITPVKPIDSFAEKWDSLLEKLMKACLNPADSSKKKKFTIVVVGSGAGGVELVLAMQYRIQNEFSNHGFNAQEFVHFVLIGKNDHPLPSHNRSVQRVFRRILSERNIETIFGSTVISCCLNGNSHALHYVNNHDAGRNFLRYDYCFWCTEAASQEWLKERTPLKLNQDGFISVDRNLETNLKGIFAVGDVADLTGQPRPKAGVFAVRQGPILNLNIRAYIHGRPLTPYVAQSSFLGLVSTGDPSVCIASKGEMMLEGAWLWKLKDWIDRRWMAKYSSEITQLMSGDDDENSNSMRCGGCGSKVSSGILRQVLAEIMASQSFGAEQNENVVLGLRTSDDIALVKLPELSQNLALTMDAMKSFTSDNFLFGEICANHAMSDFFAKCAIPRFAMAIVTLPYDEQAIMISTLKDLLSGAVQAFKIAGVQLIGGHTMEGSEISLGFCITGCPHPIYPIIPKNRNIQSGHVLIITKPLGTGVIGAADMRLKADSHWVDESLKSASISNMNAGFIFGKYKSSGCTDVTGFGLAGHLLEMLEQDPKLCAYIDLENIPLLPGASQCMSKGFRSSLYESNAEDFGKFLENDWESLQNGPILMDPQTGGGLLGCLSKEFVEPCLKELKESGYSYSKVIGEILPTNIISDGIEKKIRLRNVEMN